MAESKVRRENYVSIQGWMVADLKLKGNELIIYAIIYGFSQDGENRFSGSLRYLSDWTNSTKQGVQNALKSLLEKGLIGKRENTINGVKFCEYHATNLDGVCNKVGWGMQQSCTPPMQQSCPNNINTNKHSDTLPIKKEGASFDDLIQQYSHGDTETAALIREWLNVRKAKRAAMTETAVELNLKKLHRFASDSNMSVQTYLTEIIRKGWAAFYVITEYKDFSKAQHGVDRLTNLIESGVFDE